jgi:urease accessory protein
MNPEMITFTQRLSPSIEHPYQDIVRLTAEERRRSRYHCKTIHEVEILIALPRGTQLKSGDALTTQAQDFWVRVEAQPEPVLVVKGQHPLDLVRAAYHLGNRHIALAIAPETLTLTPDPVIQDMLHHLGVEVVEAMLPFEPESGAYGHTH